MYILHTLSTGYCVHNFGKKGCKRIWGAAQSCSMKCLLQYRLLNRNQYCYICKKEKTRKYQQDNLSSSISRRQIVKKNQIGVTTLIPFTVHFCPKGLVAAAISSEFPERKTHFHCLLHFSIILRPLTYVVKINVRTCHKVYMCSIFQRWIFHLHRVCLFIWVEWVRLPSIPRT